MTASRVRGWFPLLLLAGVAAFLLRALVGPQFGRSVPLAELSIPDAVLLVVGCVSFVLFWILMLVHFFRNRDKTKHPVAWGFSLIFVSWIAAFAYYFAIYRRAGD
jgi:hypothetical protein